MENNDIKSEVKFEVSPTINFEVILACDIQGGIGKNGIIPWKCSDDLKNFKNITMNGILIMGRKTIETLPLLPGRKIFMLSKKINANEVPIILNPNQITVINSIAEFVSLYISSPDLIGKRVFIAGGGEIYKLVLSSNFRYNISRLHCTLIQENFDCDVFIDSYYLNKLVKNHKEKKTMFFSEYEAKYIEYIL